MQSVVFRWLVVLGVALCCGLALAGQPSLEAFAGRVPALRGRIPALTASAERACGVVMANPGALITLPRKVQEPFTAEYLARAGGLCGGWYADARREKEGHPDVVIISVRSWETHGDQVLPLLEHYHSKGRLVIVIGSLAGRPDYVPCDFFIDNGAPTGGKAYGAVNLLANATLGWMWFCEYAAAFSRQGKFPGILYSVAYPDAKAHNGPLQAPEGRPTLFPCDQVLPAGKQAELYLQRTEGLVADCRSARIQGQITSAAEIVAARMQAGNTVGLSGVGHLVLDEVLEPDLQAPWKAFRSTKKVADNLQPGDLLVWITYLGMRTAYSDATPRMQEAGVELITSYAVDPEWSKDQPPALAFIEQCWQLPDAEVPIPIFPKFMAPVSGLNAVLVLRMLDEEVAKRLK